MATFTFDLPSTVKTGQSVTATATDPNGNTSEFSANGHFLLQGSGVPNQQHTLEILDRPNATTPIAAVSISDDGTGHWQYEDAPATGVSSRFYRLRYP